MKNNALYIDLENAFLCVSGVLSCIILAIFIELSMLYFKGIKLISSSCLRVYKTSKLLGIPKSKFYLDTGAINDGNILVLVGN